MRGVLKSAMKEFLKRQALRDAIISSFLRNYTISPHTKSKVPRGKIHTTICSTLNLPVNNAIQLHIKEILSSLGVLAVNSQGYNYYKNVQEKAENEF